MIDKVEILLISFSAVRERLPGLLAGGLQALPDLLA
jgi:hypothetical protein